MMKLKYLFDNRDLALMILSKWEYDRDNLEIMDNFRISSNAVYPFFQNGKICFLRFAPLEEKQPQAVQAEIDFLRYLRGKGYPAPETVLSKENKETAICQTPWGEYIAVVFKSICSYEHRLDRLDYSDELYYGYGKMLGRLHLLSKEYFPENPEVKRPDWQQNLSWISKTLKEYEAPHKALQEVSLLEDFFSKLSVTPDNFGLVHYDFEPDNVFYDKATSQYGVIDFDDSMYHWLVLDIEQAVNSIKDELPEHHHEQAISHFLNGYRSVMNIDETMLVLAPIFRRYANLYSYTRSLRALHEKWDNEPEWLIKLRKHIDMNVESKCFGKSINPHE